MKSNILPNRKNRLDSIVADLEGLLGDGPVRQEADDAHARGEEEVDDLALVGVVCGERNLPGEEIRDSIILGGDSIV